MDKKNLGQGGFGVVKKGKLDVALKVVQNARDYIHEVSVLAKLQSPFLIHMIGAYVDKDNYVIALEQLEQSLFEFFQSQKNQTITPIIEVQCIQISKDIAFGLKYLHDNGIIHADLKSQNILLTSVEKRAKICDFGSSKLKSLTSTTMAGPQIAGTIGYKAYELQEKGAKTTKVSDIFSLGIVLWEVQSFQIPFEDCNSELQIMKE
uniref:Protein kinase domain-containing protein n=1 Tax=Arcella intermedia TaxID=1963864 RepID=A0A6B2LHN6_9EUKA